MCPPFPAGLGLDGRLASVRWRVCFNKCVALGSSRR